jgi:hypothetical protein
MTPQPMKPRVLVVDDRAANRMAYESILKFKVATYAQLYLRNESMRLQIQMLNLLVQSLQAESNRRGPAEEFLKSEISKFKTAILELEREMSPTLS